MRSTDRPADDRALDALRGIMLGALAGAALVLLALALTGLILPARGQTLVSIDRADYDRGAKHIECWLAPRAVAASYAGAVLTVDCGSDPDKLFHDGFEVSP
jgi:hypothetical protein